MLAELAMAYRTFKLCAVYIMENSVLCTEHSELVLQIRGDHTLDRHADREGCGHRRCPRRGGADDAEPDDR